MDYTKMYGRYALLVVVELFMSAANWFIAPVIVLFASDEGWLPKWLWWFQTPYDSLDKDYRNKRFPGPQVGWKRWYSRTAWLYRNSMYGFCIDVLGANLKTTDLVFSYGDKGISNRPIKSGYSFEVVIRDNKPIYFQYYLVARWCESRCLRVNLGWKIWGWLGDEKNCQLTFSPNPFMGLSTGV